MSNLKDVRAKTTKITLCDGIERELRYTLNAMAEVEDRYGSVDAAFKALENNSIKAVRFVIWAGLLHTGEGLSELQVGELIDVQCIESIVSTVGDALSNDLPTDGDSLPNA